MNATDHLKPIVVILADKASNFPINIDTARVSWYLVEDPGQFSFLDHVFIDKGSGHIVKEYTDCFLGWFSPETTIFGAMDSVAKAKKIYYDAVATDDSVVLKKFESPTKRCPHCHRRI